MTNAVVGALRVDLGLDSSAFTAGLANARKSLQGVGKSMQNIGKQMSVGVTAPLAGFGALTLQTAGDFEASMNRVQAALGATEGEFTALRELARDMGSTTQFSASEAADAIEILAKNGLAASDILGGALEASLTLAASAATDMGSAGDVATDVMQNFGKSADDLGAVVDGINGVLLESKFGFDEYRQALGQAGGVAGSLGVDLAEFNAVIAATSSSFASGSDAGTSFKTFLQRLSPDTKEAAETMERLGIEFYDAQGQLKSMAEVAGELRDGMSGLSEQAQSTALSDIFGADAVRTAVGLMREGAEGIRDLETEIASASASDQAAARMEGLNGTMKELRSAFEELQLAIADSGLLETFTGIVEATTGLVRMAGDLDPKLVQLGASFAALAAALGPLLIGGGIIIAAAGGPAFAITAAIAGLTAAAIAFAPELRAAKDAVVEFSAGVIDYVQAVPSEIMDAFAELPAQMAQIGRDIMSGLWDGLKGKFADVKEGISGFASGLADGVRERLGIQSPSRVFREIGENIMQGLGDGLADAGAQIQSTVSGIFDGIGRQVSDMVKGVLSGATTLRDGMADILGGIGGQMIDTAMSDLFSAIPGFALGTNFAPGGMAIVGERGPELVNLPRGSQVVPNHRPTRRRRRQHEPHRQREWCARERRD